MTTPNPPADCTECNGTGVAERIGGYDRPCDACRGEGTRHPAEPVVTRADREAAWPYRPSCYKERDKDYWLSGKYDGCAAVIKAFACHRPNLLPATDAEGLVERLLAMPQWGPLAASAAARITELEAALARKDEALLGLEKAATEVHRHGATMGKQWGKLTSALIRARQALKGQP